MYSSAVKWGVISFAMIRFTFTSDRLSFISICLVSEAYSLIWSHTLFLNLKSHLIPVGRITEEDQIEKFSLVLRNDRIHDVGRVLLHIYQQSGHVIQGNIIFDTVHHRLNLRTAHGKGMVEPGE